MTGPAFAFVYCEVSTEADADKKPPAVATNAEPSKTVIRPSIPPDYVSLLLMTGSLLMANIIHDYKLLRTS